MAVRNVRFAGIDQSARMKISGHKTNSMEARYNILDDADPQGRGPEVLRGHADVAKLADALDLGSSSRKGV